MAEGKNKIIVYRDWGSTFESLSDEEAGRLIKHFFQYVNDKNPTAPDRLTGLLFEPIKQTLKRDLKKYEAICLRNRINGESGGRPPKTENNPKKPNGLIRNPKNPNKPDNDSDNDSDSDSDSDNKIDKKEKKEDILLFWNSYHEITGLSKTDYQSALKYWKKMTKIEKEKAIEKIKPYFNSLKDKKYCKKARTYLADKNYNDEFKSEKINNYEFTDDDFKKD